MPDVNKIIAFELRVKWTRQEVKEFLQELIDSGLAWLLQGHYGRTARRLIEAGLCSPRE